MGKFDEQSYIQRVLSPAVEAFQKEGRLPDVFERYDLPLDIADVTVIEATIHTVVNCWNKTKNNPRYTSLLASLLNQAEQDRCRLILRDQIARAAADRVRCVGRTALRQFATRASRFRTRSGDQS